MAPLARALSLAFRALASSYFFEEVQQLRVCVVDVDSKSANFKEQDLIGEIR